MSDIITERSDGILRVEFNRPEKKNAMTGGMYTRLADIFNEAAEDEETRVVLWHGAGDAFCAGNDVEDFLKNPPGPGESPQARLMDAFIGFEKPIVVAVQGAAIGGGTTMLTHCDFVYAGESAKFQLPFINLALRAGVRIELLAAGAHRASPGGGIVPAGRALRRRAGGGAGPGDPRRAGRDLARDRDRNGAEARGKTKRRTCGPASGSSSGLRSTSVRAAMQDRKARSSASACAPPKPRKRSSAFLEKRPPNFTQHARRP